MSIWQMEVERWLMVNGCSPMELCVTRPFKRSLFAREVDGIDDTLTGFVLETVAITDSAVIRTSGRDRHPILRRGSRHDEIRGSTLLLTAAELAAVDQYEVADYARVSVVLASGRTAHVYIDRSELTA